MAEVELILMFSTTRVNRSDISKCINFWLILNYIKIVPEYLNKTQIPNPKKTFSFNLRMYEYQT